MVAGSTCRSHSIPQGVRHSLELEVYLAGGALSGTPDHDTLSWVLTASEENLEGLSGHCDGCTCGECLRELRGVQEGVALCSMWIITAWLACYIVDLAILECEAARCTCHGHM